MLLETVLLWLRGVLRASWLMKDHCMSCEGAYAIYPSNGLPVSASANSLYELNITNRLTAGFGPRLTHQEPEAYDPQQ